MSLITRAVPGLSATILGAGASTAVAGEGDSHSGLWWHAMHWPAYWWIFPLALFILMIGFWMYALRKGFRGWRWRCMPWSARSWAEIAPHRYPRGSSDSALDVLNKRLAKGEVDRREYEEIKSAITDDK